jgi:hypothetical protein
MIVHDNTAHETRSRPEFDIPPSTVQVPQLTVVPLTTTAPEEEHLEEYLEQRPVLYQLLGQALREQHGGNLWSRRGTLIAMWAGRARAMGGGLASRSSHRRSFHACG